MKPLHEILAKYELTSKQWSGLVDADLMLPAGRIPGSMLYGIPEPQVKRLEVLVQLRAELEGRFTISSLAFEAAACGLPVPVKLAKTELELRLTHLFGSISRTFQRACGLSAAHRQVTQSAIYNAANKLSVKLTKHMRHGRPLSQQFLRLFLGMSMRMLYLNENVADSSRNVRELILPFVSVDHPKLGPVGMPIAKAQETAAQIAFLISQSRNVLTFNLSENAMLLSIPKVPDEIFLRLLGFWPEVCGIYWSSYERVASFVPLPRFDKSFRSEHNLMILGVLMASYEKRDSEGAFVYREVLSGDVGSLRGLFERLCVAIEQVVKAQKLILAITGKRT